MNIKKFACVITTGFICVGTAMLTTAYMAEANKDNPTAAERKTSKSALQLSEDAYKVLRSVRATRVAIFDGQPVLAAKHITTSKADANTALKDAQKFTLETKSKTKLDDTYIPFDSDLSLSRTFTVTPENAKHIENANKHFKKGDRTKAIEVLKLANIDVEFSAALLPIKFAITKISDAEKLISAGKYYEANLALKSLEDAVVIETFGIDEMPASKK